MCLFSSCCEILWRSCLLLLIPFHSWPSTNWESLLLMDLSSNFPLCTAMPSAYKGRWDFEVRWLLSLSYGSISAILPYKCVALPERVLVEGKLPDLSELPITCSDSWMGCAIWNFSAEAKLIISCPPPLKKRWWTASGYGMLLKSVLGPC